MTFRSGKRFPVDRPMTVEEMRAELDTYEPGSIARELIEKQIAWRLEYEQRGQAET